MEFYFVDNDYVKYLQDYEISKRGFTRVPNMDYPEKNKQKFVFGSVLNINSHFYFVPVTSYNIQKSENICIPSPFNPKVFSSSIRFNYMFPVPKECLTLFDFSEIEDINYFRLVLHEYHYLKALKKDVESKAFETYKKITDKICSKNLISNSCDFKILETACDEYIKQNV